MNAYSQISPSVNMIHTPKFNPEDSISIFNDMDFNPLMGYGMNSLYDDRAWSIKLVGAMDFYRTNKFSITGIVSHELNANSYNQISFNPRQAQWEEILSFNFKVGGNVFSVAPFHRCKHEIDNTDPPWDDDDDTTYLPIKRVIVLSGIRLASLREIKFHNSELITLMTLDNYIFSEEYRVPDLNLYPDPNAWSHFNNTLKLNLLYRYNFRNDIAIYARTYHSLHFFYLNELFDGSVLETSQRIEVGMNIGAANKIRIFAAYEYLFDETSTFERVSTRFLQIGIGFNTGLIQ